jgi:hypothetical protein
MKAAWENLDTFFLNEAEGGFAFTVTAEAASGFPSFSFNGIFDNDFYVENVGNFQIENEQPRLLADADKVNAIDRGRFLTFKNRRFEVIQKKPDGTGLVIFFLAEAQAAQIGG